MIDLRLKLESIFNSSEIRLFVRVQPSMEIMLFGLDNEGFQNLNGKIDPQFGIELNSETTHVIIDGVDII